MAIQYRQAWGQDFDSYGNMITGNPAGTYDTVTGQMISPFDLTGDFSRGQGESVGGRGEQFIQPGREGAWKALMNAGGGGAGMLQAALSGNPLFASLGITQAHIPQILQEYEAQKAKQQQLDAQWNAEWDPGATLLGGLAAGIGGLAFSGAGLGLGELGAGGGGWLSPELTNLIPQTGTNLTGASMDIGDIFANLDDYSGGGWTQQMQSLVDAGLSPELATQLAQTMGTPGMGDILEQSGAVTSYEGGPFDFLKKLPSGVGQLLKGLLGGGSGGGSGTGGTDFGKIVGGLLGYGMQDKLADKYFDFADKFTDKYGNRKEQLEWMPVARQMRDDPNAYMQSHFAPFISGFAGDAAAKASMQGQNNSGTMVNQVTKNVTDRSGNLFDSIYGKNLSAAGLMSPSAATGTAGDLTKTGLNMENQANSNLGFAAREATSGLLGGSRGSTDEMFNNIMKTFFS